MLDEARFSIASVVFWGLWNLVGFSQESIHVYTLYFPCRSRAWSAMGQLCTCIG
jgi:hypothetical protein